MEAVQTMEQSKITATKKDFFSIASRKTESKLLKEYLSHYFASVDVNQCLP